ncbi:MAG: tRNA 2-thiouridine(34) synthase MnmA, partial [Patescibacteria group bacterium]
MNKIRVFSGMSGGVDSSVAALLLKKQGYDVVGVFMRCWSQESSDACGAGASCSAEQDAEDARRVAGHLGIPFYVWDFEEEYKKRVVEYMVEGYRAGLTPNPDVMCNREIKFGLFLKRALRMGAGYIATGHYVKLAKSKEQRANRTKRESSVICYKLFAANDLNKDQSYFLWTLTQEQLRHCLFPIGDYLKPEVRVIAKKAGLPTAEKKDSQGICFLGQVKLDEFLKQYIPETQGAVLNVDGKKVGEHRGAQFYTIGQRHIGLGNRLQVTGGRKRGDQKPVYVAEKDVATNTLVVAEGEDNPALYKKEIRLRDVNFIAPFHSHVLKNMRMKVFARVRYRQPLALARLEVLGSRFEGVRLVFDEPQKFV